MSGVRKRHALLLALILLAGSMLGCGQKGALYLPDNDASSQQRP